MTKAMLSALVFAFSFSGAVFAAEDQADTKSTMKIEDATQTKNKVDGDIDQEITNAKLRAESGSKSKFSFSYTGQYQGSSLQTPFGKDRANTDGTATPARVKLLGQFGGRYRLDKNQSLSLGIGHSVVRPFQEARYWDVSDPYLSYNYATKIMGSQNIADASVTVATQNDETAIGMIGYLTASDTVMYDFGGSRASIGMAVQGDYYFFNKSKDTLVNYPGDTKRFAAGNAQQDYDFAAFPLAEYAISDRLQLRTVFRPWTFQHSVLSEGFTFSKVPWTQSIGLGFAATRDIYLYPNFQYFWETWRENDYNFFSKDVRASSTVGLNATINIF